MEDGGLVAALELAAIQETRRRDWPSALAAFKHCLDRFPDHPKVRSWRAGHANALLQSGDIGAARTAYVELTSSRPGEAAGHNGLAQVAEATGDWVDAAARYRELIEQFPRHPAVDRWRERRALALIEEGDSSGADEIYGEMVAEDPNQPAGYLGLARLASRRGDWEAALPAWDRVIERFPDDENMARWKAARAKALTEQERWEEAFETWSSIKASEFNDEWLIARARSFLEWRGPTDAASKLVAEISGALSDNEGTLGLLVRLDQLQGDHASVLRRCSTWAIEHPDSLIAYQYGLEAAVRVGDIQGGENLMMLAPPGLRESIPFKCRVLLYHYRLLGEQLQGLELIASLPPQVRLELGSALRIANFMRGASSWRLLYEHCERALAWYPGNYGLLAMQLTAIHHVYGSAAFDRRKAELVMGLTSGQRIRFLRCIGIGWLSNDEATAVMRAIAQTADSAERRQRLLRFLGREDPEMLACFQECLSTTDDPMDRISLRLVTAVGHDQLAFIKACLGTTRWQEFADSADAARKDIRQIVRQGVEQDKYSAEFAKIVDTIEDVSSACRSAWIETSDFYYDVASFSAWLADRIDAGIPTSFVRLSDGEGTFLPYDASIGGMAEGDRRMLQRIWWGEERLRGTEADLIASRFQAAVKAADAVGIPSTRRFLRVHGPVSMSPEHFRGIAAALGFVRNLPSDLLRNLVLTSCNINSHLEQWDLYRQIFAPVSSVSVVSCHDLAPMLMKRFGLTVRHWYRIPPEYRFASMFGAEQQGDAEPMYPTVFERLAETLAPKPGEVVLLMAGFLAKILCQTIKDRGGIALDLGSIADRWAGYTTREHGDTQLRFDVASSLIDGQPFKDHFQVGASVGMIGLASDDTRKRSIRAGNHAERGDLAAPEPRTYRFRVIGHPRCGSSYTAQVFQALGLDIWHERLGNDGICSWMHAVDDLNPPFDVPAAAASQFQTTLAYVRNPVAALPSIVLENWGSSSFCYRRFHIARNLGIDVARRRVPLERAVESYLCWMEIVDRQAPLATLRIERLREDIQANSDLLSAAGLVLDPVAIARASTIGADINTSQKKFAIGKPIYEPAQYDALPSDLADRLATFCERHNYPWPGSAYNDVRPVSEPASRS